MQRLQPPVLCNCTSVAAAIQIPKEVLSTYKDQLLLAALIAVCMVAKLPIAKFQIDEPWRARDFEINKHENKSYLLDSNKSVEISSALITKFAVLKSGSNLYGFMHWKAVFKNVQSPARIEFIPIGKIRSYHSCQFLVYCGIPTFLTPSLQMVKNAWVLTHKWVFSMKIKNLVSLLSWQKTGLEMQDKAQCILMMTKEICNFFQCMMHIFSILNSQLNKNKS